MKPRLKGVNILMSIEQYNECFAVYFGVPVVSCARLQYAPSDAQLIYYYGLRKLCGLIYKDMAILLGYGNSFEVSKGVNLALKRLCPYDVSYSIEFALQWSNFRSYCRLFRKPLSNAERQKRYRLRHSNKKKRK